MICYWSAMPEYSMPPIRLHKVKYLTRLFNRVFMARCSAWRRIWTNLLPDDNNLRLTVMKIFRIVLIIIAIFLLGGGVLNLVFQNEGAPLGYHLVHPWYGIQTIAVALVVILAAQLSYQKQT